MRDEEESKEGFIRRMAADTGLDETVVRQMYNAADRGEPLHLEEAEGECPHCRSVNIPTEYTDDAPARKVADPGENPERGWSEESDPLILLGVYHAYVECPRCHVRNKISKRQFSTYSAFVCPCGEVNHLVYDVNASRPL